MALGRPATGLPRYFMDCGWYRHPNYAGLPVEALFLMEAIVGYSTEHATDGRAPADPEDLAAALGVRISIARKGLRPLLDRGRLQLAGTEVKVPGWEDHNPTAAEIEAHTAERSTAGAKGNHQRWHVEKGVTKPGCPWCESPEDRSSESLSDRSSDPTAIANGSHGMGWDGITTPYPHAERGEHRGQHPNCRQCGTNPRARGTNPRGAQPASPTSRLPRAADLVPPPLTDEERAAADQAKAEALAAIPLLRHQRETA